MRKTALQALLAVALLGSPRAIAQSPTPIPQLVRAVDVTITNVDVVVTDKKGERVTDLTRQDFVISEDGVKQEISNFYAVDGGKAIAAESLDAPAESAPLELPSPKARISMVVDNTRLMPGNRKRVLDSLGDFIAGTLGPNVEATILTWDRHLATRGPFTSEGPFLKEVIGRLRDDAATGENMLSQRNRILRELDDAMLQQSPRNPVNPAQITAAIASAISYSQELRAQVDDTLLALGVAVDQLAGMEGRKVLIFVTERMPQIPGAELFKYMRDVLPAVYHSRVPVIGDYDRRDSYLALTRRAQSAGVAFYTLDARGVEPESGSIAERPSAVGRIDMALEDFNTTSMLELVGHETGGGSSKLRNQYAGPLKELGRDLTSYYSLGYPSTSKAIGKPLKIEVKALRPGLTVRARTARVEKTPEARVGDAVVSNLWFPKTTNPLHASLNTDKPVKQGKRIVLPLKFSVPYEKLTLVPVGDLLRGRVVFQAASLDETGRASPVRMISRDIELQPTQLASMSGQSLVIDTQMEMRTARQTLSFALTDEPSRLTSYVQIKVDPAGQREKK